MPYFKRFRSYRTPYKRTGAPRKWLPMHCVYHTAASTTETNGVFMGGCAAVDIMNIGGVRTISHLSATMTTNVAIQPIYWAFVYVPQGEALNHMFQSSGNATGILYEPQVNVLGSGVITMDETGGPDRQCVKLRSRLRKNLNPGDQIWLIYGQAAAGMSTAGLIDYSVTTN